MSKKQGNKPPAISFDDLLEGFVELEKTRIREEAECVVYLWTRYNCKCGEEFTAPRHDARPMAKFRREVLKHRKYHPDGHIYQPCYTPDSFPGIPRIFEYEDIHVDSCQACGHTYENIDLSGSCAQQRHQSTLDKLDQLDEKDEEENAELREARRLQRESDETLFLQALDTTELNDVVEAAMEVLTGETTDEE